MEKSRVEHLCHDVKFFLTICWKTFVNNFNCKDFIMAYGFSPRRKDVYGPKTADSSSNHGKWNARKFKKLANQHQSSMTYGFQSNPSTALSATAAINNILDNSLQSKSNDDSFYDAIEYYSGDHRTKLHDHFESKRETNRFGRGGRFSSFMQNDPNTKKELIPIHVAKRKAHKMKRKKRKMPLRKIAEIQSDGESETLTTERMSKWTIKWTTKWTMI